MGTFPQTFGHDTPTPDRSGVLASRLSKDSSSLNYNGDRRRPVQLILAIRGFLDNSSQTKLDVAVNQIAKNPGVIMELIQEELQRPANTRRITRENMDIIQGHLAELRKLLPETKLQ